MPKIEIIAPETPDPRAPFSGWGTRLLMDGREVPEVVSIDLHIGLDDAVRVTTEVLATERFHFEGHADLHVYVNASPGMCIIEELRDDGTKAYRCESVEGPA